MVIVENILSLSKKQGYTCMYSREEMETFTQDKLNTIYEGIKALEHRPKWKRERKGPPPVRGGRKKRSK